MAEFRTIKMSFWSDPFIENLDYKSKLLYIYMITCSHTSNLGILNVTARKIAYETGLSEEDVKAGMDLLREEGKIITDGTAILMLNFINNQTSGAPKVILGLRKLFEKLDSRMFRKALLAKYPFFTPKVLDGVEEFQTPLNGTNDTDTISDPIDTMSNPIDTIRSSCSGSGIGSGKGNKNKISCSSGDEQDIDSIDSPPSKSPQEDKPPTYEQIINVSFPEFWSHYPRKVAKADALKAFTAIIKKTPMDDMANTLDHIGEHLYAYLDEIKARETPEQYIKYPGPWLRAQDFSEPPGGDLK